MLFKISSCARRCDALTACFLLRLAILSALPLAILSGSACAVAAPLEQPLLFADRLSFDESTDVLTAFGNVEMTLGDKVLHADTITYDKKTDVVRAKGHVALTESAGEILYADTIEVTSDMKQGFIDKIGMLFPDRSRLVANDAQRYEGRYLIADRGVYTACDLCRDDPRKPPLWQLKGKRITHDDETKDVIYRDATIEFNGIPVFYTPYFSHPDPTVKRRQGFLTPSAGMDTTLGTLVRTPYYFDLAPHSDLVLTPQFSATDTLQASADWRYRFANGGMAWEGSLARTDFVSESGLAKGKRWRGHLFGTTGFDFSNTWRGGAQIAYASDKSYLPRYDIASEDVLVNKAFVENFKGRNYASGTVYYFRDQRPGDQLIEPVVAPELRYSAFGEPNKTFGGRWSFESGLLVTSRRTDVDADLQGASTRRLSLAAGWQRQMLSSIGLLTTVSGMARADGYWADHVPDPALALGSRFSKVLRTRPFAQGDLSLRYPFGRHGQTYEQLLEPIAVLSVAPRLSHNTVFPNEDSLDVEFDETNLFSPNRFTGTDRVEGGTRVAYGVRHAVIGQNGGRIEMLGGQVLRLKKDLSFPDGSGLREQRSDYVGRFDILPTSWLNVNYGLRLDQDDFDFTKQEIRTALGPNVFKPSVYYLSARQTTTTGTVAEKVEEITYALSSSFSKYWTFSASHKQAIQPTPGPRNTGVSLLYKDECLRAGISAAQDHTKRLDVEEGQTVLFQLYLRNIGGFSTD